ncbi:MAG TPA: acetyl-CoA carboxylase biotin carboxyl carrier protein [Myxococcales bacterium LLY-WYZ-16_1]|jgi:acetyl-CoA carboxylase biotin carboxyl carrier protein|nr:acetyl-CoA carboxylase biotin carboxyl carrier protein [Myxococcales bacterium LLY-WYZ-16_1]
MATKKKAAAKKKAVRARAPAPRTKTQAPAPDPTVERLRGIVELFDASGLAELKYEDEQIELRLSRYATAAPHLAPAAPVPAAPQPPAPASAPAAAPPDAAPSNSPGSESLSVIKSPFVGTFYRSPSPEAPPFCEVGQRVSKGQTLCIIEAMKLMNEIPSEFDGTIAEIVAENGQPVQFGDELFRIKTQ